MNDTHPPEQEVLPADEAEHDTQALSLPDQALPTTLYILPLSERPFFPPQTVPLIMDEAHWMQSVEHIGHTPQHMVGLLLTQVEEPHPNHVGDFYDIGCAVRMHNPVRGEEKIQFVADGIRRFRVLEWLRATPPFLARIEYPNDPRHDNPGEAGELKAYAMAIITALKELMPLNPLYSEELKFFLNRFNPNDPSPLCDFAASLTTASKTDLQAVLTTIDVRKRMEKVLLLIKKELEIAHLQTEIHKQVETSMNEQQRKFFLREQLKAIQQELGLAKDDRSADVERFHARVDALSLPEAPRNRIEEELSKLSILESGSPEYALTRNYLDWMTTLPWDKYSTDSLDLTKARKILERDHYGLDDVKQRILEFLAVGSLKGQIGGSILLLVGPPGVGKTSVGQSIARTLGRHFYRFSLGGMRDEAEIKGHRRTYIGAMPGRFIQAIKESATSNPVIMLDEIDKVGTSYLGDPASALLEALDPEQNCEFLDHYLDVRYDLSRVLFVCTANQLDTIPAPLLDRMEVIRLAGYITEEKVQIARRHLWPRQLDKAGLKRSELKIGAPALRHLVEGYAREAGVRNLEKQLARIVRKAVMQRLEGEASPISRIEITDVETYLGQPLFQRDKPAIGIGVVTGLAWTALGGVTLSVEASVVHSKHRGFKQTGKLGEVMKESAEIAYSYIAAHLQELKGDPAFFDAAFVHLHVPEGATPKDGPSAGITMATALLSLARQRRVRRPLAMTGELTLTGQILPVGGIREKVIAVRRTGIKTLILPKANQRDFEELPDYLCRGLRVHFVNHYSEVAGIAFGN